ncbi:MAG: 3-deoxy-D-manno-octulosonic acid transferase [Bacteroidales bacterium]|nr:3-deoxy-D-manno-octulosonic acid transferase [Bacteroidales bacterium]
MNLFYHLGLWLYRLIARLIAPFYLKAAHFNRGHTGLIAHIKSRIDRNAPIVWFHCASLGEFEQGRPVMEAYRNQAPTHKILLTFFSPSGYEIKKQDPIADWIFYLPLDTCRNVRRFLDAVQPHKAIFIKYEFWYNYLKALKKRGIPTYIVSANFWAAQPFFAWYGAFFRRMLRTFTLLFVQNPESKALLNRIGFAHVVVAGDTRFDRVWTRAQSACSLPVVDAFLHNQNPEVGSGQEVCVAGSSWPKDESLLWQALKAHPSLKLILVPHEVDAGHIDRIMEQFADFCPLKYSQFSAAEIIPTASRVLVVDQIGLLSLLYRYGSMAYVGGGFEQGIHNILEAAAYGVPVVFGPNHKKFNEALDLIRLGGAHSVRTGQELASCVGRWITDAQVRREEGDICLRYVKEHTGATQIVLQQL